MHKPSTNRIEHRQLTDGEEYSIITDLFKCKLTVKGDNVWAENGTGESPSVHISHQVMVIDYADAHVVFYRLLDTAKVTHRGIEYNCALELDFFQYSLEMGAKHRLTLLDGHDARLTFWRKLNDGLWEKTVTPAHHCMVLSGPSNPVVLNPTDLTEEDDWFFFPDLLGGVMSSWGLSMGTCGGVSYNADDCTITFNSWLVGYVKGVVGADEHLTLDVGGKSITTFIDYRKKKSLMEIVQQELVCVREHR